MSSSFSIAMLVIYFFFAIVLSSILGYCAIIAARAALARAWQIIIKRSLNTPKPNENNYGLTPANLLFLIPAWCYGLYIFIANLGDEMIFFSLIHALVFKIFSVSLWVFILTFILSGFYFLWIQKHNS